MTFEDGDLLRTKVTAKHKLTVNDKGTHILSFPVEITAKADDKENPAGEYTPLDQPLKRTIFVYISKAAKNMAVKNLKAMGFDKEKISVADINPASDKCFSFEGKEFLTAFKPPEGKWPAKFEIYIRGGAKPTVESLAQLDNLLGEDSVEDPFAEPNSP